MCLDVGIRMYGQRFHDVWWWKNDRGGRRFGGADVLANLAEMDFCGGKRLGQVLAHKIQGQARPSGEITGVGGLRPSGVNGVEIGAV